MTFENVNGLFEIACDRLIPHRTHRIKIVTYGTSPDQADSLAIECLRCGEVLIDFTPEPVEEE